MIQDKLNDVVNKLLKIEHMNVAKKLDLINDQPEKISLNLLYQTVGVLDELSREICEENSKIIILLVSILWNYRNKEWQGLKDFLILVLSRAGYSPSSVLVDDKYDFEQGKYSQMFSVFSELSTAMYQLNNSIVIENKRVYLTRFQKDIWKKLEQSKIVGISAPTSAGKSFIILLKSVKLLYENSGTIVYIVPTLSLVNQVSIDYKKILCEYELGGYEILNSYNGEYENDKKIFILTQEKALAAFGQNTCPFKNIRLLVIDEIQNIERVANEDEQRAKMLYDVVMDFSFHQEINKIIVAGPRINNLKEMAIDLFEDIADEAKTDSSPVASLTYSIYRSKDKYIFRQYSCLSEKPREIIINNASVIQGIGKSKYTYDYNSYLKYILSRIDKNEINLIFSPTARQASQTAAEISNIYEVENNAYLESLSQYIKDTVSPCYNLSELVKRKVAYHTGKLPMHIRIVLEYAVKEKLIRNVVCTTTLMQGVNLPAQNVIIRNPNLFVIKRGENSTYLSGYEFSNLRGRAGRLLKDFIGRTIIMDENSFLDNMDGDIGFSGDTKDLRPTYEDSFNDNKDEIIESLVGNVEPDCDNSDYSFLMCYMRYMILRYGHKAISRFKSVGIDLDEHSFIEIQTNMRNLQVPQKICLKNRYWDPIILNKLYLLRDKIYVPKSASEDNIENKLLVAIKFMQKNANTYYVKYFKSLYGEMNEHEIKDLCIKANMWIKEVSLRDILNSSYYDCDQKINDALDTINSKISYKLAMLLKPLFDISGEDNMFINYIEMGAYTPVSRRLIEMGVPRETAIFLNKNYLFNLNTVDQSILDKEITRSIERIENRLDYWVRIQLKTIL